MSISRLPRRGLAAFAAVALTVAACGSDDSGSDDPGPGGTTAPASTAAAASDGTDAPTTAAPAAAPTAGGVPGCGDAAVGDPDDRARDRVASRCEPGAPAPAPLPERTTLRVSSNFAVPSFSALYLADAMGEFEKENLEIEFVKLPTVDALPLLATGDIDIAAGAPEASFFNAAKTLGVREILGNGRIAAAGDASIPQQGIWARADVFSDPADPDLAELAGKTLGSAVGFTSVIMLPMQKALNDAGISVNDMQVEQVPGADTVAALENGAIQASWVLDPYWTQLAGNDDFVMVATTRAGEITGGYLAGPTVLEDKRDAGVAFARAIIRTISTYMPDGFPTDPEVAATLAAELGMEPETLAGLPQQIQDWEARNWTLEEAQQVFLELGQLSYDEPLPVSELADWSLYLDAVGAD